MLRWRLKISRLARRSTTHLMHVTVAARFFAGGSGTAKLGDKDFEILNQQKQTLRLRSHIEKFLLEIQIERQGAGKIERQ